MKQLSFLIAAFFVFDHIEFKHSPRFQPWVHKEEHHKYPKVKTLGYVEYDCLITISPKFPRSN